jgi:protein-S-isoprenylcysteine O-methyltransferase Ste14
MKSNTIILTFLLIVGNALALLLALLALETTPTNLLGWFLFAISLTYGSGGVVYLWRSRDEEGTKRTESGNLSFWWMIPGFIAIFFAPPLESLFLTHILPPILPHSIGLELAGLIMILLGLVIRVWTRVTIGGMYSGYLWVKVGQVLVTDGPYRFVRHPGYTGFVIMALGLCIGYSSLIGLVSIPLLLLPGLAYRMKVEERLLIDQFGDKYQTYQRKTKRLFPLVL